MATDEILTETLVDDLQSTRRVLRDIVQDMKDDADAFDGKPFNGRTVAEYFGNQGAAIAALAKILEKDFEDRLAIAKAEGRPA